MKHKFIAISLCLINVASIASTTMSGEFISMSACLKSIKKNSGQNLKVITDNPREVSGFLTNGEGFACELKNTGTKGIIYEGWYIKQ